MLTSNSQPSCFSLPNAEITDGEAHAQLAYVGCSVKSRQRAGLTYVRQADWAMPLPVCFEITSTETSLL